MISYLCRALRLSQIVLNVGAAAAGFFADFAVGGGLVGLAFFGLFNVKVSVKVSVQSLKWHHALRRPQGVPPDSCNSLLYAALYQAMKGI